MKNKIIEEADEELYIFFPPKKQYNVRVRVRFIDCAKLIYFDDEEFVKMEGI